MSRPENAFEKIVSLSKRRGFIFQSSEIYGGLGSTWDYGPLGVELKNNVKKAWWQSVVYGREDMEGLDAAIIMNRLVWQYSGHEKTFVDPLVDCKKCRKRFRADHIDYVSPKHDIIQDVEIIYGNRLLLAIKNENKGLIYPIKITNNKQVNISIEFELEYPSSNFLSISFLDDKVNSKTKTLKLKSGESKIVGIIVDSNINIGSDGLYGICFLHVTVDTLQQLIQQYVVYKQKYEVIENQINTNIKFNNKCLDCGGELTESRNFNGMFQTYVGPVQDDSGLAYLRPETAQGIFTNFLNVLQSMRRKLPFGIAQIGKSFRNEITPGNFTFRTREFEQMEIEYFCKPPQYLQPGEKTDDQLHQEWVEARYNWYLGLGLSPERLKKRPQAKEELAHYAKACVDLEYLFPGSLGWSELEGVANRQDYDLTAHSNNVPETDLSRLKLNRNEHSTEKLEYFDESYVDPVTGKKGAKYIPFVIEPSAGADRATLAFLCEAYDEEQLSRPDEAAVKPLSDAMDAALKNIQKRIAEAAKRPGDEIPNGQQLAVIEKVLQSAKEDLPGKLLQIDAACSLPGADRLDLVKKVKLIAGKLGDEHTRAVLRLHPKLAPIKVAVLPLKKNEPRIVELGKKIKKDLSPYFRAVYDDTAGIGKLYRRQDEVGTPFCLTVDFQSLEDCTVTLRDRDTMQQERVKIEDLIQVLGKKML